MTEEKKATELDKLEKALDQALRRALSGRAADLFWALENLRFARDLGEQLIVPGPDDLPIPDVPEFWTESVSKAYELLGTTRPAELTFA